MTLYIKTLTVDQKICDGRSAHILALCLQAVSSKEANIEDLLQRLEELNEKMGGIVSGSGDPRLHTLTRHKDVVHDLRQVVPTVLALQVLKVAYRIMPASPERPFQARKSLNFEACVRLQNVCDPHFHVCQKACSMLRQAPNA